MIGLQKEEIGMVRIVGNVKPEDDYTHPLGPEDNFNESVYFNFFDSQRVITLNSYLSTSSTYLGQVLHQVVSKRVVVIEYKNHGLPTNR